MFHLMHINSSLSLPSGLINWVLDNCFWDSNIGQAIFGLVDTEPKSDGGHLEFTGYEGFPIGSKDIIYS